jgi:hypothetical protein
MRIKKTVWLIMGALIAIVIIINVYTVWSGIEAQKEKLKELRYQQNPGRALSELQSGRITVSEYCDQIPASQVKSQKICSYYESSHGIK